MADDILLDAVQAIDTQDLLNHIAWTDVIQPKLLLLKEQYSNMLVNHDLGEPLPGRLTREQLAGRIYGINFIHKLIMGILQHGETAIDDLRASGFNLSSP